MSNAINISGLGLIPLVIKTSKQAKRISVRINPSKNSITLTLPKRASVEKGLQFLASKEGWLRANLVKHEIIKLEHGVKIPVLGKEYLINNLQGRGVTRIAGEEIIVYGMAQFTSRRVKEFLQKIISIECQEKAHLMAEKIGKEVKSVKINSANSRWGSCTTKGVLTFNWLLIFAPPEILDYIIAHEVAHLREMNHSDKFWRVVKQLYPEMDMAKKWLKVNGHKLHNYE